MGHYWAFIKAVYSSFWCSCNDKLVFNVEERFLNNTTSYILFYRKVWMLPRIYQTFLMFFFLQGGFAISDNVFGWNEPLYNPSPVLELSLLTQFSFRLYNAAVLSFGEALQGARSSMVLSMRSDNLTYNPSLSNS